MSDIRTLPWSPMIKSITISDFLNLEHPVTLADVRTPAEFEQGHIPGAFNLPLFSNQERVQVGTTYKQIGREEAILLGFELTGPKWAGFVRQALEMVPDRKIAIHCWRGGMRSGAMAWALDLYGFEVYLIEGGYKQYRRWVLEQFETDYQLLILGGMTGSGKTKILQQLQNRNQQVIDLEELAQHQGSSYGTMNRLVQPTQEQFENNLAYRLKTFDRQQPVWVEDESFKIGKIIIPNPFWHQMGVAVLIDIQVELERRVANLVDEYGKLDKEFLIACTQRIHKRLGPLQTKQAVAAIQENRMEDFIRLALVYYDKSYRNALSKRKTDQVFLLSLSESDANNCAEQLLTFIEAIDVLRKDVQTNEYTNG